MKSYNITAQESLEHTRTRTRPVITGQDAFVNGGDTETYHYTGPWATMLARFNSLDGTLTRRVVFYYGDVMLEPDDLDFSEHSGLTVEEIEGENEDGEVWFYGYSENPDDPNEEPEIIYIEDDDEYEAVADAFDEYLDKCEFDEIIED